MATSNMFGLLLVCNHPCEKIEPLADALYWLTEERLAKLWHELSACFAHLDEYDDT